MSARNVVAVVPDLFFSTRIAETAKALGITLTLTPLARASQVIAESVPALVLLDLHAAGDPLALVRTLKQDAATAAVPIVGFYSHIEDDLRRAALEAGIDQALPRSAFTQRLAALLSGEIPATRMP